MIGRIAARCSLLSVCSCICTNRIKPGWRRLMAFALRPRKVPVGVVGEHAFDKFALVVWCLVAFSHVISWAASALAKSSRRAGLEETSLSTPQFSIGKQRKHRPRNETFSLATSELLVSWASQGFRCVQFCVRENGDTLRRSLL